MIGRRVRYWTTGLSLFFIWLVLTWWQETLFDKATHVALVLVEGLVLSLMVWGVGSVIYGKRRRGAAIVWMGIAVLLGYFAWFAHPASQYDRVAARLGEAEAWLWAYHERQHWARSDPRLTGTENQIEAVYQEIEDQILRPLEPRRRPTPSSVMPRSNSGPVS